MKGKRVAVVVSHAAHLPGVTGALLRWRPRVLLLFRASGHEEAISSAPAGHSLSDRPAGLGVSEAESAARALAGDFAFHAAVADRIFAWMRDARPDAVLGGAFEGRNFHDDLARLLTDDAVQRWRNLGRRIENYEFALSHPGDHPAAVVRGVAPPSGHVLELKLDARELASKRGIAGVEQLGNWRVETYREVPPDRDYTEPPVPVAAPGECGQEPVESGRYSEALTFRDHFAPLVRALGLGPAARTAAA